MRLLATIVVAAGALMSQPGVRFSFVPAQADLTAAGTLTNAWADYDLDGDPDLFVGFNGAPNRLYRNDAGVLRDVADDAGVADRRPTRAAAWGDVDGDGDPDLLLGHTPGPGSVLRLYRNTAGRFTDVTSASGLSLDGGAVRQPAWIDFDADGDLDLFVAFRDRPNALYRNDGGRFTDIAPRIGLDDPRKSVGAVWFDYEEDGDLDLYVANQDGDANGLFRNTNGRFSDAAPAAGAQWAGRAPGDPSSGTVRPCAADIDGDGRLDLVAANYGPNGLLLVRPDGRMHDASAAWGIAVDGRHDTCAPADVDHDGRMDVYINGTITGGVAYRDYLWRNTGTRFEDATPPHMAPLAASHGASWADVDADGDLDLAIAGTTAAALPLVLSNELAADAARRSLAVRVLDRRGRATRAGAEVRVYLAGTRRLLATRLVDSGSGYNSQSDVPVHVGLPVDGRVDVQVIFPAGGRRAAMWRRAVVGDGARAIAVRLQ